jgi:hypothetical protein
MLPAELAAVALNLTSWAAALVFCAETRGLEDAQGHAFADRERAAIVELARVRAMASGDGVLVELARPGQFASANTCGAGRLRRYQSLAADVLAGRRKAPAWARRATHFAAPHAVRRVTASWKRRGLRPIRGTRTMHTFFEPTARASGKRKTGR